MADIKLDFVGDLTCPWCAISRRHLDRAIKALAAEGLRIKWAWRPFLLAPELPAAGVAQPEHLLRRFGSLAAAERYHAGVVEAGGAAGLTFRYDRIARTPNTMDAHRLMLWAGLTGRQPTMAEAIAQAFFVDGLDIGDRAVLASLADAAGLDDATARTMLASDRFAADVRLMDQAAKNAGIRGVPAYAMHGRILDIADPERLSERLRVAHQALAPSSSGGAHSTPPGRMATANGCLNE